MISLAGMLDLETSATLVFRIGSDWSVTLLLDVINVCEIGFDAAHHDRALP
jgi:hypothetical protein